jgi:hypothetical protein
MKDPTVLKEAPREIELKNFRKRSAVVEDCSRLISEPTVIYDTDEEKVRIVYLELEDEHSGLVRALQRIKYGNDLRSAGMLSRSRTVGFMPRRTIKQDFCANSALDREDKAAHRLVLSYAEKVSTYYQQYNPELYADHQKEVEKILPDYKVGSSVFTSGIINKDNPLPYHHDAGNFKNVWSNMLVFKHKIGGGHLAVPEYDACFELKNNSLLMFDGQSLLHGVTPIKKLARGAYRFSVVFYSLQQLWNCLPPEEEIKRYRKVRSEREYKRLKQKKAEQ